MRSLASVRTSHGWYQDLAGKWIVEMPELSAIKRSEVERNKAFMSRRVDHYRPSYGRRSQDFPRQCVFFGTTNADAYLNDETGNRRFWGVKVGKIVLERLWRERDQLWAEAVAAYKAGEKWWLDADTEKVAADAQAERRITDVWEEAVLEWAARRIEPFTISTALTEAVRVPIERQDQSVQNRIARILKAHGWERTRGRHDGQRRPWVYRRPETGSSEHTGTASAHTGTACDPSNDVGHTGTEAEKSGGTGTTGTEKTKAPQGLSHLSHLPQQREQACEEEHHVHARKGSTESTGTPGQVGQQECDVLGDEAELTMRGEALP
jgi:predicted P-loop ATPase